MNAIGTRFSVRLTRREMCTVVQVGMEAPDFSLLGASGQRFTLSEVRGQKRTLLIFYPMDMTAG